MPPNIIPTGSEPDPIHIKINESFFDIVKGLGKDALTCVVQIKTLLESKEPTTKIEHQTVEQQINNIQQGVKWWVVLIMFVVMAGGGAFLYSKVNKKEEEIKTFLKENSDLSGNILRLKSENNALLAENSKVKTEKNECEDARAKDKESYNGTITSCKEQLEVWIKGAENETGEKK